MVSATLGRNARSAAAAAAVAGEEACGEASLEQTLVDAASIAPAETRARHGAQRAIPIGGLERGIDERSAKSFSVGPWGNGRKRGEHAQEGGGLRPGFWLSRESEQRVGTLPTWNLGSWAR